MNPEGKQTKSSHHLNNSKTIWAVAGGKGGTGKSFISANLAIHLSSLGEEFVLIDADLGGPNLHTFLGMRDSDVDLGHFLTNREIALKDTAISTPFRNVKIIKGSDNVLFTSNIKHFKKLKLIRHIKALDSERIIIDIGTGSSINNIDFFLLSNPGILVTNPEPTSIENAYYFLKSCIIRILKSYIEFYKIEDLAKKVTEQIQNTSRSIYSFLTEIISQDKHYADLLYRALQRFKPCLIVNKAKDEKDFFLGQSMAKMVQKHLIVDLNFLGVVPFDEKVHSSLKQLDPFIEKYPHSQASKSIRQIAEKLKGMRYSNPIEPEKWEAK